jgi:hypothetical protein
MNQSALLAIMIAISCVALSIPEAHAQEKFDEKQNTDEEQKLADQRAKSPDRIFDDAVAAHEDGDHQRALDLLELAIFKDPQPRFIYQRVLVLEAMQAPDRALAELEAHRKELAGQPGVGDLTALEQRLREASVSTSDDNLTARARGDKPEGSDYIAWTLIGSGALAAGGGVTFFLLAESELSEVQCSGMYPEHERQDCAGVDAPAQISRAEFDQRLARVDSYRILGGSLLTLGVLAAGYGSYRLFSSESQQAKSESTGSPDEDSVAFRAAPRLEGGLDLQVIWHF